MMVEPDLMVVVNEYDDDDDDVEGKTQREFVDPLLSTAVTPTITQSFTPENTTVDDDMVTDPSRETFDDDDDEEEDNEEEEEDQDDNDGIAATPTTTTGCCGILLSKYPILSVLSFALLGTGVGIGLSFWKPTNDDDDNDNDRTSWKDDVLLKWLGLMGDMFVRSLRAVVLPLVFVNVVISVVEITSSSSSSSHPPGARRATSIGWSTMSWMIITKILASTIGVISIICFKDLFHQQGDMNDDIEEPSMIITLGCNEEEEEDSFLTEMDDGSIRCMMMYNNNSIHNDSSSSSSGSSNNVTNITELGEDIEFVINDVSGNFALNDDGSTTTTTTSTRNDLSLSDTFYDGIFTKLITSNIMGSFVDGNFAAVVIFAIVFGLALGKSQRDDQEQQQKQQQHKQKQREQQQRSSSSSSSNVLALFKEIDAALLKLIHWIIMLTPFAVFSLISQTIGKQDNIKTSFENVGYLVVATLIAMICHFLLVHVGLLFFINIIILGSSRSSSSTRYGLLCNRNRTNNKGSTYDDDTTKYHHHHGDDRRYYYSPMKYLQDLIPAQTMAFACSSSAATLPITLECVKTSSSGMMISESIANFIIPLGATINMDGSAIYFPCACIWLAITNGISEPNISAYFLLIIVATIGSAGTAPVPSASLVLIITAYNTIFDSTGTPDGFEFLLAIDWFMDRLRTVLNITGDAVICALVAATVSTTTTTNTASNDGDDGDSNNNNNIVVISSKGQTTTTTTTTTTRHGRRRQRRRIIHARHQHEETIEHDDDDNVDGEVSTNDNNNIYRQHIIIRNNNNKQKKKKKKMDGNNSNDDDDGQQQQQQQVVLVSPQRFCCCHVR